MSAHPPGAASRRSLPACDASSAFGPPVCLKTYIRADQFIGGGSGPLVLTKIHTQTRRSKHSHQNPPLLRSSLLVAALAPARPLRHAVPATGLVQSVSTRNLRKPPGPGPIAVNLRPGGAGSAAAAGEV